MWENNYIWTPVRSCPVLSSSRSQCPSYHHPNWIRTIPFVFVDCCSRRLHFRWRQRHHRNNCGLAMVSRRLSMTSHHHEVECIDDTIRVSWQRMLDLLAMWPPKPVKMTSDRSLWRLSVVLVATRQRSTDLTRSHICQYPAELITSWWGGRSRLAIHRGGRKADVASNARRPEALSIGGLTARDTSWTNDRRPRPPGGARPLQHERVSTISLRRIQVLKMR